MLPAALTCKSKLATQVTAGIYLSCPHSVTRRTPVTIWHLKQEHQNYAVLISSILDQNTILYAQHTLVCSVVHECSAIVALAAKTHLLPHSTGNVVGNAPAQQKRSPARTARPRQGHLSSGCRQKLLTVLNSSCLQRLLTYQLHLMQAAHRDNGCSAATGWGAGGDAPCHPTDGIQKRGCREG